MVKKTKKTKKTKTSYNIIPQDVWDKLLKAYADNRLSEDKYFGRKDNIAAVFNKRSLYIEKNMELKHATLKKRT